MLIDRFRLDGRRAFITGGATGIGLTAALAFAEAGADVVIAGPEEAALTRAQHELESKGYAVATERLDITQSEACQEAADRTNRDRGLVDILVANAGVTWPDTAAEDLTDEAWRKLFDVNVHGTFWTCRAFGRHMLERKSGSVVTTGSISGVISNKPQRQAHYNSSKAAIHHLTKCLAGEWATRGVRVNCVAPTYVNTSMSNGNANKPYYFGPWMDFTPMGRMVEPEEIAAVMLFLASEASSAMTGAVVLADAGYTVW
jgi:NAD(P)-dependent dehydrogenase (short-subunit alcohol dehydrogenase family)